MFAHLASLLRSGEQLDAAEEVASRAIGLLPENSELLITYQGHRILGEIWYDGGETKKAIHHFEIAFRIASSLNRANQLFWIHYRLAQVFSGEGKFVDAQAHIEHARSHAVNDMYLSAYAMEGQARLWNEQRRSEDAKSEALCALDAFEKLGAADNAEATRQLLHQIEAKVLDDSNHDGELLETILLIDYRVNSSCSDWIAESE